MCGVIGLCGPDIAWEAYRALIAIQHRGQNSAGILTKNEKFYRKQGDGLVSEVFQSFPLEDLEGNLGIGHVRYPTAGMDPSAEAQPLFTSYPYGLGLAHNGNLTNCQELKCYLHDKHRLLQTDSDTEILLNVLAEKLSKLEVEDAIGETMDTVQGSYSATMLLGKEGGQVLAIRDPHGIRPLVLGKKETETGPTYMVCSESVGLDVTGYELVRDIAPGEMVSLCDNGITSRQLRPAQPSHCIFEYVYFSRPDSVIEGHSVYDVRFKLGTNLAFDHEVDTVIPVPDTARTAALGFALENGIAYREGLIKNRYIGRTFIMPTQRFRESAIVEKLNVIRREIEGKRIALVDDSIVRGTTSRRIVGLLRRYGAKEVHFVSSCPPITHPCFYGIDMTIKDELIASCGTEGIEKKIGADSVTYQSIDGLVKAIGIPRSQLCLACLTGEYPTCITCERAEMLGKCRENERNQWKDTKRL
ncbi:MAG: amidophosphoribosyltransferase [Candidatus Methanofastidiosa archaeon]|nr:amidophosphoribosyltransferase [Candidatus Methanofastidiosa archaeon]